MVVQTSKFSKSNSCVDSACNTISEEDDILAFGAYDLSSCCMSSGEAVDFVRKQLKLHGDVQRASEEIGQEALVCLHTHILHNF